MSTLVKRNGLTFPGLVSDLLDTNLGEWGRDWFASRNLPSANITETPNDFKIEIAAPGLERKDFKVQVENGLLTISSEKEEEKKNEGKDWIRKEFSYNSFSRSFQLPENVMPDKIDARYDNGLLKVVLPKKEVTSTNLKKEIKVS